MLKEKIIPSLILTREFQVLIIIVQMVKQGESSECEEDSLTKLCLACRIKHILESIHINIFEKWEYQGNSSNNIEELRRKGYYTTYSLESIHINIFEKWEYRANSSNNIEELRRKGYYTTYIDACDNDLGRVYLEFF
jgi:hypothetical protein